MTPIERLAAEHRLIDRMLEVMKRQVERMNACGEVDHDVVDVVVDFMRTFADLTHHGKEETILFAQLAAKSPADELARTMAELKREHEFVRERTTLLVAAQELHLRGSGDALQKVTQIMGELIDFYPPHEKKEETQFFVASMGYFDDAETDEMLREMAQFDRNVIHEKYTRLVEAMEKA